jgi:hypothetical protein
VAGEAPSRHGPLETGPGPAVALDHLDCLEAVIGRPALDTAETEHLEHGRLKTVFDSVVCHFEASGKVVKKERANNEFD